jgi:hypothetical protein
MASKKAWIWVIVGVISACVLALFVLAGAGMYFVTKHIKATRSTSAQALDEFDRERSVFKDQRPLIEIDEFDHVRETRPLGDIPTSAIHPDQLWIMAWNPNEESTRLVKVSVPFWMLRLGRRKFNIIQGDRSFDFDRLNIDVNELERIGPALILDYQRPSGERVLVWTS